MGRNVKLYGVEAVFGRPILYEYEMDAMRISMFVCDAYNSRASSGDMVAWERANIQAASFLKYAAEEYNKAKDTWLIKLTSL